MKKTLILCIMSLVMGFAHFSIAQIVYDKGYYDYSGELGEKTPITLSFYNQSGQLKGAYVIGNSHTAISLTGIATDSKLILKEFDALHKHVATFEGTVGANDAIDGYRTELKSGKTQSFHCVLRDILSGVRMGHRYETAGFSNDTIIDNFTQKIQKALKEGDKVTLANAINYPITVHINGQNVVLKNSKGFMTEYNGIFHPTFKKALLDEPARFMFANDQGVMFGSDLNNVWIATPSGSPKKNHPLIVSINN